MEIGLKIRKLRKQQNRTLQDVADKCGFSKSLLSKIENGLVVPPVATLARIAEALGTKVSSLMEEGENDAAVFTQSEDIKKGPLVRTDKGYVFYSFANDFRDKKMQPCLFYGRKGEVIRHSVSHEGEEFIYMLEGRMKIKVGKVEYEMNPGDSLYFDSIEEHGMMPISDEVKYIDMFIE
jgi:transcriptional regulator with XRE-family HTH domain